MKRNPLRRRILSVQSLESRRLLASLASRLPPIRVVADEPIIIADTTGSTYEISQIALRGLRALEQLLEIDEAFAAGNVDSLSQHAWRQVEANPQSVQTQAPTFQQATKIVTIGFQRIGDDPFGAPLSSRAHATTSIGESEWTNVIDVASGPEDSEQIVGDLKRVDSQFDALTVVRADAIDSVADSESTESSGRESSVRQPLIASNHDEMRSSESGKVQAQSIRSESSSGESMIGLVDSAVDERGTRWSTDETLRATKPRSSGPTEVVDPVAGLLWLSMDGIDADTRAAEKTGEDTESAGFDPFAIVQLFLGDSTESDSFPDWPTLAVFSSWGGEAEQALTQLSVPLRWSVSTGAAVLLVGYLYYSHVLPQRRETVRHRISLCK